MSSGKPSGYMDLSELQQIPMAPSPGGHTVLVQVLLRRPLASVEPFEAQTSHTKRFSMIFRAAPHPADSRNDFIHTQSAQAFLLKPGVQCEHPTHLPRAAPGALGLSPLSLLPWGETFRGIWR